MATTMVLQTTPAERAVLQLLSDGNATREIANRLRLSERALDTMVTALLERMGAASPVEAVMSKNTIDAASEQWDELRL